LLREMGNEVQEARGLHQSNILSCANISNLGFMVILRRILATQHRENNMLRQEGIRTNHSGNCSRPIILEFSSVQSPQSTTLAAGWHQDFHFLGGGKRREEGGFRLLKFHWYRKGRALELFFNTHDSRENSSAGEGSQENMFNLLRRLKDGLHRLVAEKFSKKKFTKIDDNKNTTLYNDDRHNNPSGEDLLASAAALLSSDDLWRKLPEFRNVPLVVPEVGSNIVAYLDDEVFHRTRADDYPREFLEANVYF
jgi:hypothetical protein